MNGLYEDMGNILSRYYKIGEISEDEMKSRLGIKESKGDCGCGCGGTTPGGCGDSVNEESVKVSNRTPNGNIVTTIKEVSDLNEEETKLYEFGLKVEKTLMNEKNCPTDPILIYSSIIKSAKKKFDVYPSSLYSMDGVNKKL